jgi:hypothetical protein
MVQTRSRCTTLRFRRRVGRSGAASMKYELANSLDCLPGMNAELANSTGRSSAGSDSQVKTWVCLKAGRLELTAQIVSNARLRAHPAIPGTPRPPLCESSRARTSADGRSRWHSRWPLGGNT